jgi:hypothetical protein
LKENGYVEKNNKEFEEWKKKKEENLKEEERKNKEKMEYKRKLKEKKENFIFIMKMMKMEKVI